MRAESEFGAAMALRKKREKASAPAGKGAFHSAMNAHSERHNQIEFNRLTPNEKINNA